MSTALSPARLIVNADDFGFTRDVNAGIVASHREGILTSTTVMATGAAFEDAVRLAKENSSLDIGCHLVLVQGEGMPQSIPELLWALATRRIDAYAEFSRQVRKILNAGLQPTHLDTHKHTHLAPPVYAAVLRISREFGIPWVRRRIVGWTSSSGIRTTDHFLGFRATGRLDTPTLAALIRILPNGLTELMCHPGFLTQELQTAATRLKESRVIEYQALISPAVRQALKDRGARLVSYRDL